LFTDAEKDVIRRSWRLVVPIAETAADLFYRRLFELRPEYRRLFPDDLAAQKRKLVKMLAFVVRAMDWSGERWRDDVNPSEDLMLVILALGRRHSELYEIPDDSYAPVGEALLWTLDYGLGDAFDPDVRAVWSKLYGLVAQTMRMGSAAVDPEVVTASAEGAHALGEEALQSHLTEAGSDEARLGFAEEPT